MEIQQKEKIFYESRGCVHKEEYIKWKNESKTPYRDSISKRANSES